MKLVSTNPGRNYEVIGEVEVSTEADVKVAVEKARAAQPKWAALSIKERCAKIESFVKLAERRAEDIAQIISKEMGMPIKRSRTQVAEAAEYFRAFMGMAEEALQPEVVFEDERQIHTVTREPRGVVACIAPWNFPFLNIPWHAGQTLIAGNTVVFKNSEEDPLFSKLVAEIITESDLPDGVFNFLYGDGKVGEMMVRADVDAILFTGSTVTGKKISELAAQDLKPVVTELGGSAPGIVFEDADVDAIIETLYGQRFDNTGQYCDGLKRLLVHVSKLDEVLAALKRLNDTKKVGDPLDEATDIGPLVAKRQLDKLEEQVKDALDKGAKVEFGGQRPEGLQGAYYLPTVLTNISFDMRVWREEVFGPVLPVATFETEDEAVKLANDTIYGLGAYVFTNDKEQYRRVASQLQSGLVAHNNALFYGPTSPFGGYKQSGNSRTLGREGFHEVTQIKLIAESK